MSRINEGLYSSCAQDWQTPPEVYQPLLDFLGIRKFALDPCSLMGNVPSFQHFAACGLERPWHGNHHNNFVWINPPYGKALQQWLTYAAKNWQRNNLRIWMLVPARTETIYQQDHGIAKAGFTVFLKGRICFLKDGRREGTAPFPTMLLYFGEDAERMALNWVLNPPLKGTLMRPQTEKLIDDNVLEFTQGIDNAMVQGDIARTPSF